MPSCWRRPGRRRWTTGARGPRVSSLGLLAARVARARLACSVARDRQIGLAAERDLYQMMQARKHAGRDQPRKIDAKLIDYRP